MQGTQVHEIPGGHSDVLLEPNLRHWAEILKMYIQNDQSEAVSQADGANASPKSSKELSCSMIPLAVTSAVLDCLYGVSSVL